LSLCFIFTCRIASAAQLMSHAAVFQQSMARLMACALAPTREMLEQQATSYNSAFPMPSPGGSSPSSAQHTSSALALSPASTPIFSSSCSTQSSVSPVSSAINEQPMSALAFSINDEVVYDEAGDTAEKNDDSVQIVNESVSSIDLKPAISPSRKKSTKASTTGKAVAKQPAAHEAVDLTELETAKPVKGKKRNQNELDNRKIPELHSTAIVSGRTRGSRTQ
jgi:hypothetical protein